MGYQEFQDAWESDPSNPELDSEEVAALFDDCDYDYNDLIDIDEMQCFIDGIGAMLGGSDEDPEQMMDYMDTDDDGYLSLQELIDFLNNDREQNGEEPMSSEEEEETATWFSYGDTDGDDLLNLDEFTQMFGDDDDGGDEDCNPDVEDCGDDDAPPTPEEAMEAADANEDGYVSLQEFEDFWESDPENPELDSDAIATLFDDCDYDENDLIDINEVQCFIDSIGAMFEDPNPEQIFDWMDADDDGQVTASEWADFANSTGDIIDEDNFNGLVYTMDMYDYDDSNGLDIYEFAEMWDEIDHDDEGDDGDEEGDPNEPFRVTMMVMGQTLNAPISDFEVRFLVDCGEPDEEGNEPPISNCMVAASNGLTEGSATVDPALIEYEFTYEYLDYDGDGLISDMDTLVIDNLVLGVQVELYDNWAEQYTSESFATAEMLPGFGALMVTIGLLGAAMAGRRD
jgi:Ca2+-binding EF-hand superfamily protein